MKITLSPEEKIELELLHSQQKDRRLADKIKSVLLRSEGWSLSKIAQAMRLGNDTIGKHITEYLAGEGFEYKYRGSNERLSDEQSSELCSHLQDSLYEEVIQIVSYVKITYSIEYSVSGMTDWLHKHKFSYKMPKGSPSKADTDEQIAFVDKYEQLKASLPKDEPLLFIDGVHPTMQSKTVCGWIKTGSEKSIPTTASRTRLNVMGAIELSTMKTTVDDYETINARTIKEFLGTVKAAYPLAKTIHIILDNAGYHRAIEVAKFAEENHIKLHFLPTYSPNLNPIERLWKIMNEEVRNNQFFASAREFKEKIRSFFRDRLPEISGTLRSRINDNFHILKAGK